MLQARSHHGKAGGFADEKFRELRAGWRRRPVARAMRWAAVVLGLAAVAVHVLWGTSLIDFYAGGAIAVAYAVWSITTDDPPPHVENWRRGAEGERRTAKSLRALRPDGWAAVHDVQTGRANRDHVLVGPAGVFLLETKRPRGEVGVAGDRFTVHYLEDPDPSAGYGSTAIASRVRGQAAELSAEVARATGRSCWVHAVVVVWAPFPQRVHESNRVTYVHGDALADWLRSRRAVMPEPRRAEILASVAGPADARARARVPARARDAVLGLPLRVGALARARAQARARG